MTNGVAEFTPRLTRAALEEACRATGLDPTGAVLVRLGENAMYRLFGESVMVRIGRSEEAARKETLVAEWLAAHDFHAVRRPGSELHRRAADAAIRNNLEERLVALEEDR